MIKTRDIKLLIKKLNNQLKLIDTICKKDQVNIYV